MRRLADRMFSADNTPMPWHVDLAAMLSQIGAITLPPSVLDELDGPGRLRPEEEEMALGGRVGSGGSGRQTVNDRWRRVIFFSMKRVCRMVMR